MLTGGIKITMDFPWLLAMLMNYQHNMRYNYRPTPA